MRSSLFFIVFLLAVTGHCLSQNKSIIFPNNARVCFVGNSITMNGEFVHYVRSFYTTRFPEKKVQFFNCGISGDVTSGILARMEPDIMVHKPDYAIIMIGMNDVNRPLYSAKRKQDDSLSNAKQQALTTYKANLEKIIQYFISRQVNVILEKPSIYDQTAVLATENLKGVNDALGACAGFMQEFADKYKLPVVDYWAVMGEVNKKMQQKDPTATIVGADRVHPASPGHFVMAATLLEALLHEVPVAHIDIDLNNPKKATCKNCTVSKLQKNKTGASFQYAPGSLPFYVSESATPALQYVHFTNALNKELLQVKGLPAGSYGLYMNDTLVSSFTNEELQKGINLATLNTPEYRQSKAVVDFCLQYRSQENDLRSMRYIEYRQLLKYQYGQVRDSAFAYIRRTLQDTTVRGSGRTYLEKYLTNKPNEAAIWQKLAVKQEELLNMVHLPVINVKLERQ